MIDLAHLFDIRVEVAPVKDLGQTLMGHRRIIDITGGEFRGERLSGRVLPGGADWQIIRADGSAALEARYTLETGDGAMIYVNNTGFRFGPPEVLQRVAEGEDVDPTEYYFRSTPVFETSATEYSWLNRTIALATGARRPDAVELEVFEDK
jgi:hypothetical protein